MHEMALAEGILEIALDYAKRNEASKIAEIGLLVGELAGVETEALRFGFSALSKGTMAEGAKLHLRRVPLVGRCQNCGKERRIQHYRFLCPMCKDGILEIISGRELRVEYLEVDD